MATFIRNCAHPELAPLPFVLEFHLGHGHVEALPQLGDDRLDNLALGF
jgi:hypothetical protein